MSLERACVNCMRCYHLAQEVRGTINPYRNDQVYQARNEAMKALEDVDKLYLEMALAGRQVSQYDIDKVEKALQACESCTYDEPRIVEVKKGRTYSQTEKKQE